MKKLLFTYLFILICYSVYCQSNYNFDRFGLGQVAMTVNTPTTGIISNVTQATQSSTYYLVNFNGYADKWSNTNTPFNSAFTLYWGGGSFNGSNGVLLVSTTSNRYYTLQIRGLSYSDRQAVLMETDNAPQSFHSTPSTAVSTPSFVSPDQSVSISITLAGSKSSQEKVFVRYTTNNWTSSSVVEATGAGNTWSTASAIIPSSVNTAGTTVKYYAYTTTVAATNSSDHDLITLKLGNNGGTNYSYTVSNAWTTGADGNWSSTTTWLGGEVPPSNEPVIIASSVTLDQDATVSSLMINTGATFTASDATARTLTISKSVSGLSTTLTNNGTWANGVGGSTVLFTGSPSSADAIHAIIGTIAFNNITINKTEGSTYNVGASFGTNSSVLGTLEVVKGGYVSTDPPANFYSSNAILMFNLGSGTVYDVNDNDKSWSKTQVPNYITINSGTVNLNANRTASGNLLINPTALLNIEPTMQLTVGAGMTNNGTITLKSDATGTATILTPATISGSGTSNVQQYYTTARQWWYVSSPVSGAVSAVFNPEGTNKLGYWDESNCTYPQITNNSTALTVGKGYLAKLTGSNGICTFTGGALNTGDITLNPAPTRTGTENLARGYNLVGNPYPSFLDWNNASNIKTNLRPTIWYRTANSYNEMVFDTFDGGIGTGRGANGLVSSYIPPMQAFWVKVDADGQTGVLTFSNSARLHCDQSSTTNRLRAPQKVTTTLPIVRLIVSNGVNSDEAILVADENAADVFDNYDSPKMSNNNASIPEIFTLAGSEQLVINHLNNFDINKQIALGFRTATNNTFSIKASELSNIDNQTKVVLIDRLENEEFDLSNGQSYNFSANASTTTDRFVVAFRAPGSVTKIANTTLNNQLLVYVNENRQIVLKINGDTKVTYNVTVCNSVGQVILNKNVTQNNSLIDKQLTSGVYMVSINDNANTVTKRIIIIN